MSQISVIATINEPVMRQRLSVNLSAFHPAITVAEVATAAEQTPLLQGYPIHNLISPPPAVTHRPLASMQLGGELQLEWQTLQGQHSSRMDELIAKMDRLEDEVISLRPLKETIASLEVEVDSLRPLKETITSLEVEVDSLRPLKTTVASLDSYVTPIRGAINDALLPMADSLAIRCLLDVFLHQQGYSQQLHGSRRDWVEDNKTKIFEATGIPEGDIERIFRTYRSEADVRAHVFKADTVAYAVTRITDHDDQQNLEGIFTSALCSTVEDELDNPNTRTLRGGFLNPGEMCIEP